MYLVTSKSIIGVFSGVTKVQATIIADTASDLPAYNNCKGVDGELTLGSMAFIASTGKVHSMTSNGVWHEVGGGS